MITLDLLLFVSALQMVSVIFLESNQAEAAELASHYFGIVEVELIHAFSSERLFFEAAFLDLYDHIVKVILISPLRKLGLPWILTTELDLVLIFEILPL